MPRAILILLFLVSAYPSSSQTRWVVSRDVPMSPTIVVVPTSFTKSSLEFADKVEEALINFKLRTVQRPSIRQITETKGASKAEGQTGAGVAEGKSLTEQYIAYEETGADYVLLTDQEAERVKLVLSKTREILATEGDLDSRFELHDEVKFEAESMKLSIEARWAFRLYKMLEAAGLPVRGKK